jgi:hypothetical protein
MTVWVYMAAGAGFVVGVLYMWFATALSLRVAQRNLQVRLEREARDARDAQHEWN